MKSWHGDFNKEEALKSAIKGCTAVFLNFMPDFSDLSANLRQAKCILSIAKDVGADTVYSSGVGVDRLEKLLHWDPESIIGPILRSKLDIEEATKSFGLEYWTILRPAHFMANYIQPLVRMYDPLAERAPGLQP